MPQVAPDRQGDPPQHHGDQARAPQTPPEDRAAGGRGELLARPELVRQGEAGAEVGVEMEQVPRLVAQPTTGGLDAGRDDHDEGGRACGGQQHAGVVGGEVPQGDRRLGDRPTGVPPGDGADVHQQQRQGREAHDAVDAGQSVLAERALEQRDAGHEEHLHQQQDRGDQTAEPAEGLEGGTPEGERRDTSVCRPPPGHQGQGGAEQGGGGWRARPRPGARGRRCLRPVHQPGGGHRAHHRGHPALRTT